MMAAAEAVLGGREAEEDREESDWTKVRSEGRKAKECYNCHEVGHLRQECNNRKRVKCFNCEQVGHVQRDCAEPAVVRPKEDGAIVWKDNSVARKIIASRSVQSSSGMTVVQAFLEVEEGKMWKVKREIGVKILEVLGLDASSLIGRDNEVKGIQARGSKVEFWLSQCAEIEKYLVEDIMILLEDGVKLTAVREVGKRTKETYPFMSTIKKLSALLKRLEE